MSRSAVTSRLDAPPTLSSTMPAPIAYTIAQVLAAVPISRSYLYLELRSGRLRSFKIGRRRLVAVVDLVAWLAARRDAATSAAAGASSRPTRCRREASLEFPRWGAL